MATFSELMQLASVTIQDKTSLKRAHEIEKTLRKNKVYSGLTPEKATRVLEELGPTFVKIGQLASDRSDMIPAEYAKAFKQLRTNVTPEPFSVIIETLNQSLGRPWQEVFSSIEGEPLGAASVAQVHKAVLREEGNPVVAVKVRRRNAVEQMAQDFTLIHHALALADVAMPANQGLLLNVNDFIDELERTTEHELDFKNECENLLRFGKLLATVPGITCPKAYSDISSDDVLVMEYVEGPHINELDKIRAMGDKPAVLGERLAENFVEQILDWGFFHADPHAGNIIVRDKELVWIDLGMMGKLDAVDRQVIASMCEAVVHDDAFALKEELLSLAHAYGPVDHGKLLSQISNLIKSYATIDFESFDMGKCLMDIIELMRQQNLMLPSSLTMLARGAVAIEGVLSEVSPSTNLVRVISKRVKRQMLDPHTVEGKVRSFVLEGARSTEVAVKIPTQISETLDIIDHGQLQMRMDVKMPPGIMDAMKSSMTIVALALITAGMFIGSALISLTGMTPRFLDIPLFGFLGFLAASALAIYIVYRCIHSRRKEVNDRNKRAKGQQ